MTFTNTTGKLAQAAAAIVVKGAVSNSLPTSPQEPASAALGVVHTAAAAALALRSAWK